MSDDSERKEEASADETPRWLEVLVPTVMLVISVAYAIELKDIPKPGLNLLLLQPLLLVFWILLVLVGWLFLVPLVKSAGGTPTEAAANPPSRSGWRESLAADSPLKPRLLTLFMIIYALVVFQTNYIVSTFCFLAVTGFLLGSRTVLGLGALAIGGTGVLYATATFILDIRLY